MDALNFVVLNFPDELFLLKMKNGIWVNLMRAINVFCSSNNIE